MVKILINIEECDGCATCARVCENEVYEIINRKSTVKHPENCVLCRECELQCPNNAIEIIEE
jgi:2-oxoglutarate ferredoxin oxidoreductase subunit delta